MNKLVCKCGNGHASQFDGLCRFCREKQHSPTRRTCSDFRIKRGEGLPVEKVLGGGAVLIAVALLAGCERVTEYKCSAEQIEAARAQFDYCKLGAPLDSRSCWSEATRAHCDVSREYMRTGDEVAK